MEKKYLFIIAFVVLLTITGVAWYKAAPDSFKAVFSSKEIKENLPENTENAQNGAFPTRQEAPESAVVPEPGQANQDSEVAIPQASTPAAPGIEDKRLRSFDISAKEGKYTPSTIIVNIGDTVHINFRAEDDAYDIVFPDYGLKQTAKQGETKVIEFQAVIDGQFAFYCENACPKGEMEGILIVKPE